MNRVSIVKLMVCSPGIYGLWNVPKNKIVLRIFMMMMLAYLARKNRANGPAPYSVLNQILVLILLLLGQMGLSLFLPGLRRIVFWSMVMQGRLIIISVNSVRDPFISRTDKRIIASVPSYEIV